MIFKRKLKDFSSFDNKDIIFENAEVILTRRCNLKCGHCMRGQSQNIDMSEDVMDSILDKVTEFGNLCIGGGELTSVPKIVEVFVDKAIKKSVRIKSVNLTTNGIVFSQELAETLLKLKDYVEECRENPWGFDMSEEKPVMLRVSLDDFHLMEMERLGVSFEKVLDNIKKYQEILGEDCVRASYGCDYDVLREGRAKNISTDVHISKQYLPKHLYYMESNKSVVISPVITIGATGEVIPLNIAFDREKVLSFGNIKNEKLSAIMQRFKMAKVEDSESLYRKTFSYMKKISTKQRTIKRYSKSKRFNKRLAVETILQTRGQSLKEDYENFTFEQEK